eukprot:11532011-Karenia_brevis.AAC.1
MHISAHRMSNLTARILHLTFHISKFASSCVAKPICVKLRLRRVRGGLNTWQKDDDQVRIVIHCKDCSKFQRRFEGYPPDTAGHKSHWNASHPGAEYVPPKVLFEFWTQKKKYDDDQWPWDSVPLDIQDEILRKMGGKEKAVVI